MNFQAPAKSYAFVKMLYCIICLLLTDRVSQMRSYFLHRRSIFSLATFSKTVGFWYGLVSERKLIWSRQFSHISRPCLLWLSHNELLPRKQARGLLCCSISGHKLVIRCLSTCIIQMRRWHLVRCQSWCLLCFHLFTFCDLNTNLSFPSMHHTKWVRIPQLFTKMPLKCKIIFYTCLRYSSYT